MKNLLLGSLCLFLVVGCQTYPKKPTYVGYGRFQPINHSVPSELQPFELPPKPEYVEGNQSVPKQIIVVAPSKPIISVAPVAPISATSVALPISGTPITLSLINKQSISQAEVAIKEISDVKN